MASRAARWSRRARPPGVTLRLNVLRSRLATFASGTPISVCISTTRPTTPGPSCTPAAPSASEVCKACRPCTRRRHCEQWPDLDIETPHKGAHLRQFFLILRRHPGHVNRAAAVRTRRRHRRRGRPRRPVSGAGGSPADRSVRQPAVRDAGRDLAAGPWQRGLPVGGRPAAPRRVAS